MSALGRQAQNPTSPVQTQPLSLIAKTQDLRGTAASEPLMNQGIWHSRPEMTIQIYQPMR